MRWAILAERAERNTDARCFATSNDEPEDKSTRLPQFEMPPLPKGIPGQAQQAVHEPGLKLPSTRLTRPGRGGVPEVGGPSSPLSSPSCPSCLLRPSLHPPAAAAPRPCTRATHGAPTHPAAQPMVLVIGHGWTSSILFWWVAAEWTRHPAGAREVAVLCLARTGALPPKSQCQALMHLYRPPPRTRAFLERHGGQPGCSRSVARTSNHTRSAAVRKRRRCLCKCGVG